MYTKWATVVYQQLLKYNKVNFPMHSVGDCFMMVAMTMTITMTMTRRMRMKMKMTVTMTVILAMVKKMTMKTTMTTMKDDEQQPQSYDAA